MVDLQTVSVSLAALSFSMAAVYYILTIRHNRKTRQVQLFMQLFDKMHSREFMMSLHEVYHYEWDSYQQYNECYGPVSNPDAFAKVASVWNFLNSGGILVKEGVLDARLVYEWDSGENIVMIWDKYAEIIIEMRGMYPRFMDSFEYLVEEMKKLD